MGDLKKMGLKMKELFTIEDFCLILEEMSLSDLSCCLILRELDLRVGFLELRLIAPIDERHVVYLEIIDPDEGLWGRIRLVKKWKRVLFYKRVIDLDVFICNRQGKEIHYGGCFIFSKKMQKIFAQLRKGQWPEKVKK